MIVHRFDESKMQATDQEVRPGLRKIALFLAEAFAQLLFRV